MRNEITFLFTDSQASCSPIFFLSEERKVIYASMITTMKVRQNECAPCTIYLIFCFDLDSQIVGSPILIPL